MTRAEPGDVSLAGIAEAAWSMVETDDANVVVESDPALSADPDRLQRVITATEGRDGGARFEVVVTPSAAA